MDTFQILLVLHIVSGFIALVVAPAALVVKKGGPAHRFWGKVFFGSMVAVAVTAVVMSFWKSNIFLAMVGVFSFYLVASGYRALYIRKAQSYRDIGYRDWLLVTVSGIFCLAMVALGVMLLAGNFVQPMGYISILFGLTGAMLIIRDIRNFTAAGSDSKKMNQHISGMIGGYIAVVSAFSVVNFEFIPDVIRWLWPTFLGVPYIIFQIRRYDNKMQA